MNDFFSLLKRTGLNRAALLFCCVLFIGFDAAADDYDVYILAGQSNMDGRADAAELSAPLAASQKGVWIYYVNPGNPAKKNDTDKTSSGWQALSPGYSVPPSTRGKKLPSKAFGPEVSFGYAMHQTNGNANANANGKANAIAIIKITRGGTNLRSDWSPTGFMYKSLIAQVNDAMAALKKDGHKGVIRGMLWHQGESDSRRLDAYQAELETLIANVRKAFGQPKLPFLIGELAPTKPAPFRRLQQKIADDNDFVSLVSSKSLKTKEGTHFDTDSQVELGKRFAAAMAGAQSKPPR